ncbi:hypothetical protein [Streptomyces violascens]|uniref:Secreted protein n=1 Tax=Streptomyces violascens TaxID=67381 RepID=A0ABQ3QRG2_9ACTN|nr:hypothetical protein [Streptomyces violascens]GGU48849.1 hypothetical protein GCM10010289_81740 [Streptomyces violascens]GHI39863.1 hypothetical protein Sviol_42710 [Streptomyces violascens]
MSLIVTVILAVVLALVVCAVAVQVVIARRRRQLRERFGPEYERTVEAQDSRRAGERELREREERHDALDIRPLPAPVRERYSRDWAHVQEQFVDRPDDAVHEADRLVTSLMSERGYPTAGYEQQLKDLSVEHGNTLEHYRAAHQVNERSSHHQATTEELRGAMVHYRALFEELLHNGDRPGTSPA